MTRGGNERASEMTIFKSSGKQWEGIYKTVVMERQKIKEETTANLLEFSRINS